ncbi:MAG: GNAT family N-acetyltransferase [Pseudomonadota bacterium]
MSEISILFREKFPADEGAVYGLWERSVRATHTFLSDDDFRDIRVIVRDQYVPNATLEVAVAEDRIVGFMGMSDLHIDALFIDPDRMGAGIGKRFIARAKSKGYPITVDVNEQNTASVEFYLSQGFSVTKRLDRDSGGRPYPILYLMETEERTRTL